MIDPGSTDVLATAAAIRVVKKVFDGLATTVRRGAGAVTKRIVDKTVANLQIGFTPYLQTSYTRCGLVETLLSQDRPLALLDVYVNLLLDCRGHHLTDDALIEDRRIVITG
jgi:hypothetical protein